MRPLCALTVSVIIAWSAGCSLFRSHQAPAPPQQTSPAPPQAAPETRLPRRIRSKPSRSRSVLVRKPRQPNLNQPPQPQPQPPQPQPPSPAPLVTLENSDDAKANAQRSLDQATLKMAHINRAELAESTASTYQQANELINEAQRAMADQDYLAASSLAEKASALTSQLPSQK